LAGRLYLTRADLVAIRVLNDWKEQGRLAPPATVNLAAISRSLPESNVLFAEGELLEGSGGARPYRVDGRVAYFRKRDSVFAWVAFELDQAMQLGQAPKTQIALLDGWLGVLSEQLPGELLAESAPALSFQRSLRQGVEDRLIDPGSLSDAEGFHFLIGDEDGWADNFIRNPEGIVVGFDFDGAFARAFSWHHGNPDSLGAAMPRLYTPRFVTGLSRLTDSEIRRRTHPFPAAARRQIAFRRDMMLKDIAERGDAAILRDWQFPLETDRY
jgi:hypothetical protein